MPKKKTDKKVGSYNYCFKGKSGNVVCPTSKNNKNNPDYKKELAKKRKEYKPVPKSQDKRGRPKLYTKAQAKERQKERDKKRKPAVRKYKKKEAPKPMTFTRLKKPITLSFD